MRILTYQQLDQKRSLLPLMEQAFGWPFDPLEFDKNIKADPRLRDSGVGFCGVVEGKTVAYVGVMDLATRTVDNRVERVGGIYGVATLPGHTRKGICTALLNRAHEHFKEKDYRFSFLTTSPTIVAHGLYMRLGYFDVTSFPGVYKVKEKPNKQKIGKREKASKLNLTRMLEIYREYVKNRTGFVARDETYMKMLVKTHEIAAKECITTEKGYVIFKKDKKQVRIRELVAHDKKEMNELIGIVEDKAQNVVYGRDVLDPTLREAYADRGFTVLNSGHGVLMVKELTSHASFKKAYDNRFYMSALDHF
jgi:ribosomal protein S18 acetylase RimI-like enzyme